MCRPHSVIARVEPDVIVATVWYFWRLAADTSDWVPATAAVVVGAASVWQAMSGAAAAVIPVPQAC